MLDFSFNALVQIIWTLVNFIMIYMFFSLYFYPKFKENIQNRLNKEVNRKNQLVILSDKISSINKKLSDYKHNIIEYKKSKIQELEKEISLLEEDQQKRLRDRYLELRRIKKEEMNLFEAEKRTEDSMINYAKLICQSIANEPVDQSKLVSIFNKMKFDINIIKKNTHSYNSKN